MKCYWLTWICTTGMAEVASKVAIPVPLPALAMSWSGSTSISKEAFMARTPDHQGDSPRTAGGGQRRPPQEQRASEPDAAVVVLTSEGQRRLAVRAAWLATELVPRLAHSQDGWASGEYERAVSELARLTRILGQAMTTHELPPEDPGIVELGDEVVVEFAAGDTERYLVVDPIEAPLDDVRISVESPLAQALIGRRVGEQVEVNAPAGRYRCRILTTGRYQTAAPSGSKTSPSRPRPTG
jgi:transcription elongation GreA/GreB family factor